MWFLMQLCQELNRMIWRVLMPGGSLPEEDFGSTPEVTVVLRTERQFYITLTPLEAGCDLFLCMECPKLSM